MFLHENPSPRRRRHIWQGLCCFVAVFCGCVAGCKIGMCVAGGKIGMCVAGDLPPGGKNQEVSSPYLLYSSGAIELYVH